MDAAFAFLRQFSPPLNTAEYKNIYRGRGLAEQIVGGYYETGAG